MDGILNDLLSRGLLSEETMRILTGQQPVPQRNMNAPEAQYLMENATPPALSMPQQPAVSPTSAPVPSQNIPLMIQAMNSGQTGLTPGAGAVNAFADQPAPTSAPMSGFDKFAKALELAGRGLTIAGSKDPATAYAAFSEMDKPKITPLAGGAFSMVTKPDGTQQIVKNEDVAQYLSDQNDMKKAFELLKIKEKAAEDARLAGIKTGEKQNLEDKPALESAIADTQVLRNVAQGLRGYPEATGPIKGLLPKTARDIIDPTAANFQQQAEGVALKSLRSIFGAQFTENEGKQFLARYYNPRLPAGMNADNLERMADDIESLARNKEAASSYLAKNGTLKGFQAQSAPKASGGPVKISSDDEFNKLPSGTEFIGPDGKKRRKP